MKRLLVLVFCLSTWCDNFALAEPMPIDMIVEIIDDTPDIPATEKIPMRRMPRIYHEDCTLFFSSSHPEYIINIMQDDEIVYTSVIPAGVVEYELPSFSSGIYTLKLIKRNLCYMGYIEF